MSAPSWSAGGSGESHPEYSWWHIGRESYGIFQLAKLRVAKITMAMAEQNERVVVSSAHRGLHESCEKTHATVYPSLFLYLKIDKYKYSVVFRFCLKATKLHCWMCLCQKETRETALPQLSQPLFIHGTNTPKMDGMEIKMVRKDGDRRA